MIEIQRYKTWRCEVVVAEETALPRGADAIPRNAVDSALERAGIEHVTFSGWEGPPTELRQAMIEGRTPRHAEVLRTDPIAAGQNLLYLLDSQTMPAEPPPWFTDAVETLRDSLKHTGKWP